VSAGSFAEVGIGDATKCKPTEQGNPGRFIA